jgi:hypothetical protein
MGGGRYDEDAHVTVTKARAEQPKEQVFSQRRLHPSLDPRGVKVRESRDSKEHPNSVGIIMVIDQTGSMQDIPVSLAKKTLPQFMSTVINEGTLADPQVMFMAIGDAESGGNEQAPLQVGQFESEGGLMDNDLTNIFLEGQGGGNDGESYDLALYFAAEHTDMDCTKRGEKGYLFLTGDEPIFPRVSAASVRRIIGDELKRDIPVEQIVAKVRERFHVFFLIPDPGRRKYRGCEASWRDLIGDCVIPGEHPDDTSLVAATLIGLTKGTYADMTALRASLKKRKIAKVQAERVCRAVKGYAESIQRGGESPADDGEDAPTGKGPTKRL